MKIAVYAIAKNEENNVEGWYESAKDADEIVLVDTGSDDDTYDMSRRLGIKTFRTKVEPWRFDDARNTALHVVSEDIDFCIALDLDERLQPNWREAFKEIKPDTTRVKYHMTTIIDGKEFMWYWANRCHKRQGYHWEYAVHEKPVYHDGEEVFQLLNFNVSHEQDDRHRNYLEMLKECTEQHPEIQRYSLLYGRELLFNNRPMAARTELKRSLTLLADRTKQDYAEVYRYMGHCQITPLDDFSKSLEYCERRETLIDIAKYYSDRDQWRNCLEYCDRAFNIKDQPVDFISFSYAWGARPYVMAALAAMYLGEFDRGLAYAKQGLGKDNDQICLNAIRIIGANESLASMI